MARGEKYVDLTSHLLNCGKERISMTVEEISKIIDLPIKADKRTQNIFNNSNKCGFIR